MNKTITSLIITIGFAVPAFAGGIIPNEPDYSILENFQEAQYEAQLQQQLDNISAQIEQMAAAQAEQVAQAAQAIQERAEQVNQEQVDPNLYIAIARQLEAQKAAAIAQQQQQLEEQRLAAQSKQEESRWIKQQKANLRSHNPIVRQQARENLGIKQPQVPVCEP